MNRIIIFCNQDHQDSLKLSLQDHQEIQIVDYVFDGQEALRLCSQTEVDLILIVLTNDFEPARWYGLRERLRPGLKKTIKMR